MFGESFVFGLVNSLHCVGMCGPLALCAAGQGPIAAYHGGRIAGYVAVGAVAGALGDGLGSDRIPLSSGWLSLGLALSLVVFAFGGFAHLGRVPGLARVVQRGAARAARLPAGRRAAVLGLLTPLLPCGLLYVIVATALLSGGALAGAGTMGGFALGAVPALGFAQANAGWLRARVSAAGRATLQRTVLLASAALLAWRGWSALGGSTACCG